MPVPIWIIIQVALGAATGPVAVMLVELAALIVNLRSSDDDARFHRGVLARLDRIAVLIGRQFQPVVATAQADVVVEPQPSPRLPASLAQTRELARETQALAAQVRTRPIDNRTIIGLSQVETNAKYAWQAGALDDTLEILSPAEREAIRRAIPDWEAFRRVLADATNNNEILILPRVSGITDSRATDFYAGLSYTISRYNDHCERSGGMGPERLRQAQKLRLASRVLAPDLEWTDFIANSVHKVLHMTPSICAQIDLSRGGAKPGLMAWLWALGDDAPTAFKPAAPFAAASDQSDGALYAAAQTLILLLADALSLGASEGVSVLADLLAEQGMPENAGPHMERLATWYQTMHAVFDSAYGGLPIIGVPGADPAPSAWPTGPTPLVNGPDAKFLGEVRGALMSARFVISTDGYAFGSRMFLAARDNLADSATTCYLAIERHEQSVSIWSVWRMADAADQATSDAARLNACALECQRIHQTMAREVAEVARDEPWVTLRLELGERLRQQRAAD